MKVAVISDIHANSVALDAVYGDLEANGCEKILVLGDLVGYYYDPFDVVEKIRNDPRCVVIKGNHEELLLRSKVNNSFADRCYKKYGSGLNIAIRSLTNEQLSWISLLENNKTLELYGKKIGLYHGSEKFLNEYIYPDTLVERLDEIITDCDFLLFGHTHYPVVFNRGNYVVVNPGSVGQPRDFGSLASYVIINLDNSSVIFRRIPFSSKELIRKTKEIDPHFSYLSEILERNNPYAKY